MPLVSRLARQETVGEMLLAANSRYDEGLSLLDAGYRDGGIYLLGYAAEMILKTSFCRVDPTIPPYITVRSRFVIAERRWISDIKTVLLSGYEHSILFWESVLPLERTARHKWALGIVVSQTLSRCIRTVSENWAVKRLCKKPSDCPLTPNFGGTGKDKAPFPAPQNWGGGFFGTFYTVSKMRYQPSIATAQEADDMRTAVSWLHDNQRTLWS